MFSVSAIHDVNMLQVAHSTEEAPFRVHYITYSLDEHVGGSNQDLVIT